MPSGTNHKSIAGIPIKVIGKPGVRQGFHWKRRSVQILAVVLAILIPASGLFRIDPEVGAFVVVNRQIWFSDFFLIAGTWVFLASCLVLLYSTAGTVFCGWVCPQNTLAEWANNLTRKLLGKRAEVSLTGEAPKVAAAKNKLVNWLLLGLILLGTAMVFALIPLFYFYPPQLVWAFVTFQPDAQLARSLHWIYTVSVLVIFLDIAVIRHFWCRFSCIYRVWQHSFKTKQTLHIKYDDSRADECAKCNYCVTACFIDLDPRKTAIYDSCINCGECIDACDRLHAKQGVPGLLRFEIGEREQKGGGKFRTAAVSLFARTKWATLFGGLGAVMFVWGLWTYQPYHVVVYRAETQHAQTIQDYRIAVSNKLYRPAELSVHVQGLPQGSYHLSAGDIKLLPAGHGSLTLSIARSLPRGLYSIMVDVSAADGWAGHFHIQHYSEQE
ncbi:MAG: 4Fe-4S binding protein [Sideroxydans sp.]|nr:4Fe-4S binding protein [Sideroxydans sp.]